MRKMKPSVKTVLLPTLVLTSTAAITYAVPRMTDEKISDAGNKLKLDIERVDSDTVKVSIDNVQDIPKALQFSIALDGVSLQDGQNSIKDLISAEVQNRIDNNNYTSSTNDVITDYTYNENENTIDVLITSNNSLPKVGNKVEVFELDVKKLNDNQTNTYKILPNDESEYKYVNIDNVEYADLGVVSDNKEIQLLGAPTITSVSQYITLIEGQTLTLDELKDQLGVKLEHDLDSSNLQLKVYHNGKEITEFKQDNIGIYSLELRAVKDDTLQSDPITAQINVVLDNITTLPIITKDGNELTDVQINAGEIFLPLEGVQATDAKGRDVKVSVKSNADLDLDPTQDTDYTLTYTATDIYGNMAMKEITLKVIANQAPVISGAVDQTLTVGDEFDPRAGVTVTDDKDQNIQLNVESNVNTRVPGTYKVSYSATDSGGKTSRIQITVTVNPKDSAINQAPTITVQDQILTVGDVFEPLKVVSAHDAEDGNITDKVEVILNEVDTSKAGTYKVVYRVTDSAGETATKEIKVTVKDKSDIVLATSILINEKDNNKLYVNGEIILSASVNSEADLKDIEWKISDSSIVEMSVNGNKATLKAKKEGTVTLTAMTTDGSQLTDSMEIRVMEFKQDNEIPQYIKDIIDETVLKPISGVGSEKLPIEFEVKDVKGEQLNSFLNNLKTLNYELISINEDQHFTLYKLKLQSKNSQVSLQKSDDSTYVLIKVNKSLTNANEINQQFAQLVNSNNSGNNNSSNTTNNNQNNSNQNSNQQEQQSQKENISKPQTGYTTILGYVGVAMVAVGGLLLGKKKRTK